MNIKTREIYSEVYAILNTLGKKYISKLPLNLYQMIKEENDDKYNPKYNSTIALKQQNIKKETLLIIALLHLNYWCGSQEEKTELRKIFMENEIRYQTELKEKYSPDKIFKKEKYPLPDNKVIEEKQVALTKYKENILKNLINKIKNFFNFKK